VDYDIVVVGAGPAGSVAAYECAKRGFKTLLLEKAILPFISHKLIGITVFRDKFDDFLSTRAVEAGAELAEDTRVIHTSVSDECATIQLQDGREIKSDFLIGADGVNSIVSRSLNLRPKRKDLTRIGLGMEADFYVGRAGVMKATKGNPSVLEILPVKNRISYGWIFPKREHLAIGIAGSGEHMRALRPDFDGFYQSLEKRLGVKLKLEKRRTSTRCKVKIGEAKNLFPWGRRYSRY
jgi:flavin-dependent dehydrogenase